MPTYTYTPLANFIIDQLWGIQTANLLKNNVRYLAEDIFGNPAGNSHMIPAFTMDNGATHGGRIFFNGGSTAYIGSDAAGLIFQMAGFTSASVPAGVANSFRNATSVVTGSTAGVGEMGVSSASGSDSTTSGSISQINNLSVTLTTTGRPVKIYLIPGTASTGTITTAINNVDRARGFIYFKRDSTLLSTQSIQNKVEQAVSVTYDPSISVPCSSFRTVDFPAAGTYVYTANWAVPNGETLSCDSIKLVAEERV